MTRAPLQPPVYKNGIYPDRSFPRTRRLRRRRLYLRIIDWGGIVALCALLGGMFFFAVAVLLGAFWLMLDVLDLVVRRLEG